MGTPSHPPNESPLPSNQPAPAPAPTNYTLPIVLVGVLAVVGIVLGILALTRSSGGAVAADPDTTDPPSGDVTAPAISEGSPVTEDEATTGDPVTADPVTEPVTEDPVAEDPVTDDPVAEDPVTEDESTSEDPGSGVVEVSDTETGPGDCLLSLSYNANGKWEKVECATPHEVEVVAESLSTSTDFPGEESLRDESSAFCVAAVDPFFDMISSPDVTYYNMWPTQSTWDVGDRDLSCLMVSENGAILTGSFLDGSIAVT